MISKACVGCLLALVACCSYCWADGVYRDTSGWSDCYTADIISSDYETSRLLCAVKCSQQRCAIFIMTGEMCELIFDGNSTPASLSTALYRRLLPASILTSKEVARGRPVTGSPQYESMFPSLTTDGDLLSLYHSTDNDAVLQPYLLVDLQGHRFVEKIRVLPVAAESAYRFVDVQVLLGNTPTTGDFSNYTVVATIVGPIDSTQSWLEFDVSPPRCSRYVALYKYVEHPYDLYLLEVHEIEVMARTY